MDRFHWKRLGYHGASALLHQSSGDLCNARLTSRVTVIGGPKMACFQAKSCCFAWKKGKFPGWDAENAWFVSLFGALKKSPSRFYVKVTRRFFVCFRFHSIKE